MEVKCVTCGKSYNSLMGVCKDGHQLLNGFFVCNECAGLLGIPDGLKGDLLAATYTVDRFVKRFNQITGQNVSAQELKQEKQERVDTIKTQALEKKMQSRVVKRPGINLMPGEVCYYQGKANAVHLKNVVTGSSRVSSHVGGRLGSGYIGGGVTSSSNTRGNVAEKYPGMFFITNKRMILNAPRYGFDLALSDISTMDMLSDGISIMGRGTSYLVETSDVGKIKGLIKDSNALEAMKRTTTGSTPAASGKGIPEQLREYKSLLDDGIITQEEFDEKKRQLLNQ